MPSNFSELLGVLKAHSHLAFLAGSGWTRLTIRECSVKKVCPKHLSPTLIYPGEPSVGIIGDDLFIRMEYDSRL
jgi:hypothetical protein